MNGRFERLGEADRPSVTLTIDGQPRLHSTIKPALIAA